MKNKKGISLIVLVITIIVMIILAASIIVSLNNNNIIGKAKDAVDATNLKQVQELAQTIWADAYINGARTQQELYDAVIEGLEEANVDTSKYTIIVTTNGVTVTTQTMNEYGFYFDILYEGELEESVMGITEVAFVFHEDGSAEGYGKIEELSDSLYCIAAYEEGSLIYSKNKIEVDGSDSDRGTVTDEGLTLTGTFDGLNITATYTGKKTSGIYYNKEYEGQAVLNGQNVLITTKLDKSLNYTTVIKDLSGNLLRTVTGKTTSYANGQQFSVAGADFGMTGEIPFSMATDGKSILLGMEAVLYLKDENTDGNTGENDFEPTEWEIAWVYKDGAWSDAIEKGGVAEGDFVARLYLTDETVNPASEDDELVTTIVTGLGLVEGPAYRMVLEGNGNMPSVSSQAWNKHGELDPYYSYYITEVIIEEGIENIPTDCFGFFISLETVEMTNTITAIGKYAFAMCEKLKNIKLSENITSIGEGTFMNCHYLSEITIPDLVTEIGMHAFNDCKRLTTVNLSTNLNSISPWMFFECKELTSINISSSVKEIGERAFYGCENLSNVVLSSGLQTIGNAAFTGCSFANITLPETVTDIGQLVFENCTNLSSLVIPSGVEYCRMQLCNGCTNLTSVTLSDKCKGIGSAAFANCVNLASIVIPNNVYDIGGSAFSGCTKLTSIIIPSSVGMIKASAFSDCINLKTITINKETYYTVEDNAFMNIADNSIIYVANSTAKGYFTAGTDYDSSKTTITIK